MTLYNELRNKYPVFNYNGYKISETEGSIKIEYSFEIEGLSEFNPTWTFKKANKSLAEDSAFKNMVFNLGLVELVSYWKLTCSPKVVVKCGSLTDKQVSWWKKLYYNGLGECFYLNGIEDTPDAFMNIECTNSESFTAPVNKATKGCMVPIGGGKDSIVSLGVLESNRNDNYCYIINPRGATLNTVKTAGYEEKTIIANRTLDSRMIELNKKGFINGHTPFSAIVAFSALIAAYINDVKYIALSNESSANESTVEGSYVNHQYSKSFEFEKDFNDYEKMYIQSGIHYFSLLRPLSEYQIAGLFAKNRGFYKIFRSCNAGSKQDIWCGNCPKCLFVYIIMSPFISPDELTEIFGSNLFEKESLKKDFTKLIGMVPEKPFECVGSRDEINFALCEAVKKYDKLPLLLEYYKTTEVYKAYYNKVNPYMDYYETTNLLPKEFDEMLKKALGWEE